MADSFQTLDSKIRVLLGAFDRLEAENRSFRRIGGGDGAGISHEDVIGQLESLKLEKEKLEKKLDLVEKAIERVIGQIDSLEF